MYRDRITKLLVSVASVVLAMPTLFVLFHPGLVREKAILQIGILIVVMSLLLMGSWTFLWRKRKFHRIKRRKVLLQRSSIVDLLVFVVYFSIFLMVIYLMIPFLLKTCNFYLTKMNSSYVEWATNMNEESKEWVSEKGRNYSLIDQKRVVGLPLFDVMAYKRFRSQVTQYLPMIFLTCIFFFVILPFLSYSKKKLLLGAASTVAGTLTSLFFLKVFPKAFGWELGAYLIAIPLSLIRTH